MIAYLQVFDMNESVETREGRFSRFVRLQFGDAELMLNTAYDSNERPERRNASRWAGHADVTLYIDCPDVDAVYAQIVQRGSSAEPPRETPWGRSVSKSSVRIITDWRLARP